MLVVFNGPEFAGCMCRELHNHEVWRLVREGGVGGLRLRRLRGLLGATFLEFWDR